MIIRSTDQIKRANIDAVRGALAGRMWITIAKIVRLTRLSVPTVGRIIDEMVASGEVLTCAEELVTGGRRARQYMLNPAFSYTLCIYLDQKLIWYDLSDVAGDSAERGELPVEAFSHRECIDRLVGEVARRCPALKAVSIGVPAWVDRDVLQVIQAYPGLDRLNFRTMIGEKYGLPCRVTNDLNALVTGYYRAHFADRKTSLCALYLSSSGPGTGLIVDGRLMSGAVGFAGEVGYVPVSGGSFKEVLLHSADHRLRVRAVAEAAAALMAFLNPQYLLFCTYGGRLPPVDEIVAECRTLLPEAALPEFIETEEYHRYYLAGLRRIAGELIAENR